MSVDKFLGGYRKFREGYFRENEDFIHDLMAKGQKPSAIMIACSDSRIDPSLKFDVAPGEMFIVRNVAALVPPFEQGGQYHGTSAALEFAVRALEVENVIVMGHARCGGIHSLMNNPRSGDFVGAWMKIADDARKTAAEKVPLGRSGEKSEIAKLAVFLCSQGAGYIVGQTIVADGGTTALMSLISDFRTRSTATFGTGYVPGL